MFKTPKIPKYIIKKVNKLSLILNNIAGIPKETRIVIEGLESKNNSWVVKEKNGK